MDFTNFTVPIKPKSKQDQNDRRYTLTVFKGDISHLHLLDKEESKEVMKVECRQDKVKANLSAIYSIYKRANIKLEFKDVTRDS